MSRDKVSPDIVNDTLNNISVSHQLCRSLIDYIDTHIYTINKLDILSDVFGYNYCHLSSVFKEKVGITLASYYRYRRLSEAKKLLAEGRRVGEVSDMLRYSSMYSFSKAFKRYWGVSPKPYSKNTR